MLFSRKKLNFITQELYSSQISYVKMKSNPAWETVKRLEEKTFSCRYLLVRMLKTEWITRRKETIIMLTGLAVFWTLLGVHHNPFKSILCKSITVRVELLWQQCNWSLLLRGKLRYRQVCWLPCSNLVPGATGVGLWQLFHLVLTLCYESLTWSQELILMIPKDYFTHLKNTVLKK